MLKIKLERDRALVSRPCLRIRTRTRDHFLWWYHRRLRYCWCDRELD